MATSICVKVKFLDENDDLRIEYFENMRDAYQRLEAVREARAGDSFPLSMTVTPDYTMKGRIKS